ncbi:MAG: SDR family oxidoreductase [Polyangiaceae bacterium]|nr:SDR family oxidoreductase [Polyangiaceae bacterium]
MTDSTDVLHAHGKVALVTGGSSGIGLAFARMWVRRGGRVALVARTASKLKAIAKELDESRAAAAFPLDVQNLQALVALPAEVVAKFGRLDVVVNNAGLTHRGSFDKFDALDLASVITTNLAAPVVLTRAAAPHIAPGGSIIQIASIAGMFPVADEAAYSASKAGLRFFARAIAGDLALRGVHSGCVCPGPVDTDFLGDLTHVSDIVLSQPMISAEDVAVGIMKCIDDKLGELALPRYSGKFATLGYLLPKAAKIVHPLLEKRGAKNRARAIAKKRGVSL